MSQSVSNWFKILIADKVTIGLQAYGGLLDSTMMSGDVQANIVKFPFVSGQSTVYPLTGGIQPVPVNNPGLSVVQMTMADFEASEWWTTQDAYKAGASEKDALSQLLQMAIRRKRDQIKIDALRAFWVADGGANITTTGTGAEVPDVLHFEKAAAELKAAGDNIDDEIYCLVPQMWFSQLSLYKEYSNSQWAGPSNSPFTQAQRMKTRTVNGVNFLTAPDSYFYSPAGGQLESWMWMKNAMGAETPINLENASISQHTELQGSPWLAKAAISGAAIGIQPKGVKRFLLQKINTVVRGP